MSNTSREAEATPRLRPSDLTARARIRNAALDLYSEHGEARVSMRAVAGAAGVTVGLVQHHFGTKDGLREAVDQLVVDYFDEAVARGSAEAAEDSDVVAARDRSVRAMLEGNPEVAQYVRRALLEPRTWGAPVLGRLATLIEREIEALRRDSVVSTTRPSSLQALSMALGQIGEVFLDPVVDALWERFGGDPQRRPRVRIVVEES